MNDRANEVIISIAGWEPTGAAGCLRDLDTFNAMGAHQVAAAITQLTAQNRTDGVKWAQPVSSEYFAAQLQAIFERNTNIMGIKIGALGNADIIGVVADLLEKYDISDGWSEMGPAISHIPVVLDPVFDASAGGVPLLDGDRQTIGTLRTQLIPRCTLFTPNLAEAAKLLYKRKPAETKEEIIEQGMELAGLGAKAVLIKGGHFLTNSFESTDWIFGMDLDGRGGAEQMECFRGERIEGGEDCPGTGCTLASAITVNLGRGMEMGRAIGEAKQFVRDKIVDWKKKNGRRAE